MMPIKPLSKGQRPTPMDAEYFNRIVFLLNALIEAQITPGGVGNVKVGDRNIIFDFSPLAKTLQDQLTQMQQKIDQQNTQITALLAAMRGASGTAQCNADGSISISISFPGA